MAPAALRACVRGHWLLGSSTWLDRRLAVPGRTPCQSFGVKRWDTM
jgi:hypothetical protein